MPRDAIGVAKLKVRLRAAADAVERSKRAHHDTVTTRDDEMSGAEAFGMSIPEIAAATGLSNSRTAAILANNAVVHQDRAATDREATA